MRIPASLSDRTGDWIGENRLWLDPADPCHVSGGTARVETAAGGTLLLLRYTWSWESDPQEGVMLLGVDSQDGVRATWTDSWHLSDALMACTGAVGPDGVVSVKGAYAAPPGPDWGWRITLQPDGDGLVLRMFNASPDGDETLAVEAAYGRRS